MSSRRWFRFALFATALVVLVPHAVSAATSLRAGWWTSTAIAIAPDAPPGSLVVQGGVTFEHPSSYAAIEVALEPGETAIELHLTVVEGSASSPNTTLALCPLTESFSPAEGGSTKDGPEFDCGEQVEASPSKDGATYDIDVSGLGRDDGLALAILPTMPTDRVVLEPPTIADITTVGDEGSSEPGSALDNSPPAPSSEARPTTTMPAQSPSFESPQTERTGLPDPPTPRPHDPDPVASSAPEPAAPAPVPAPLPVRASSDGSLLSTVVYLAFGGLAAGLWLWAGSTSALAVSVLKGEAR